VHENNAFRSWVVTAEQVRALKDARPFRPFTIRVADGPAISVPHQNFISMSPGGRIVIVYGSNDSFSIVDLFLVTELEVHKTADSKPET
jgi:hypothetical protein